jgi:hypothetical protein
MPEILRWPFRIVMYFFLYVLWLLVALVIGVAFPNLPYLEAINLLPAGWIPIAAVFFADIYLTQVRRRRSDGER